MFTHKYFNLSAACFLCTIAAASAAIVFPSASSAQASSLPANAPQVSAETFSEPPNVTRKLIVAGYWPDTCLPSNVDVDDSVVEQSRTLFLRLLVPQASTGCAPLQTPYRLEASFTPTVTGVTRVFVTSPVTSVPLGLGRVVTASPGTVRSASDISGNWYDPATKGSGINFVHSYWTSDAVFATWYVYSLSGAPRWYSVQNVTWKDGASFEGTLYETEASPGQCKANPGETACPIPNTGVRVAGTVRAQFFGLDSFDDTGPRMKVEAFSPNGTSLFSSQMSAIRF
jgi:hypothetical protein